MRATFAFPRSILAALVTALVAGAPPAAAQDVYGFGTAVDKPDYDFTPVPSAKSMVLCFHDTDNSGSHNAFEPLYLHAGTACTASGGKVVYEDIRLIPIDVETHGGKASYKAGTLVRTEDADFGYALAPTAIANDYMKYYNIKGDSKFDKNDALYLDIVNNDSILNPGDLRLTKMGNHSAGSFVRIGDEDLSVGLVSLGLRLSLNVYKAASTWYANVDGGAIGTADVVVEEADVRLTSTSVNPIVGSSVTVSRLEPSTTTPTAGQPFQANVLVVNKGAQPAVGTITTRLAGATVDVRGTPLIGAGKDVTLTLTMIAPPTGGPAVLESGSQKVNLTVVSGGDPLSMRMEALEGRVADLEAQLSRSAPSPGGDVQVQGAANSVPGVDVLLLVLVLGLVAIRRRPRA